MIMEKELLEYLNLLRVFGRIYTQRIMNDSAGVADLKQSQVKAIYAFRDQDSFSMKELADRAGVKLPNMTMMVDEMERSGMIMRVRDKDDRRKVMVGLTAKGRKVRNGFLEKRQTFAKEMFVKLQKEDKEELLSSLASVCRILDKTLSEKG
jgi:DNA-binding MarR family transcriptional regulator